MSEEVLKFSARFSAAGSMNAKFSSGGPMSSEFGSVTRTGGGTTNYERLTNKPSINDVALSGNKTIEDLGVRELTNLEIAEIINRVFD